MANRGGGLFTPKGAGWPLALLVVAGLTLVLGVVQWMELLIAQASGETFCSVDETFDCASVWAHPAAKAIQRATQVPVAGWGVIWSLGASAASVWLLRRRLEGRSGDLPGLVARLFGVAGIGTAIALFVLSMSMGTYCLTCLTTYVFVAAYGAVAFKQPLDAPLAKQKPAGPIAWAIGLVVAGYLVVLYPGSRTPVEPNKEALRAAAGAARKSNGDAPPKKGPATDPHAGHDHAAPSTPSTPSTPPKTALGRFLAELNPPAQRAVADALAEMKRSPKPTTSQFPVRVLHHGPADAKVKIVDFSDIRCGHCAQLAATTDELRRLVGDDVFSQESRWFPLDAECNPKLDPKMTDGTGVRCAGARALICLEGEAGYEPARKKLFSAQRDLTSRDMVVRLAADAASISQKQLEACMADPKTESKLRQDIEYAWSFRLQGTPLVVVNGRKASPIGPFLYALLLAEGDLEHPAWARLPATR